MKKAPSINLQAPEKHQTSKSKQPRVFILKFDAWNFSGCWMLELGCFVFIAAIFFAAVFPASAQKTEIQFLSGHGKDDAVPWKFFCTSGANSGVWTNLPVPSQWDVKGFGTLNYHKDLTNAWNERGLYEHDFPIPQNWSGRRIFLVFDGVMTDTDAKLNGQSVGAIHQGSFYRFKYEVTSLVKFGETNKLEVTVAKHSANQSVNNAERLADYWVFGGIFRPVYLEAVPQEFIGRAAIDARADGKFSAEIFLTGVTGADEVEAQIQTLDGKNVGEAFRANISELGQLEITNLQTQIISPKLWTAETPNLYQVEIRLKQNEKVIHEISQRFGFRTFEVRDGDGFYLNGRRIILKGADRHSFWPDSGRCLSEAVQRLDIQTMKDANMNAVRMSHYPPDEQFLDLCDELGLYVLDELAGWHHFYDNDVGPKLVKEMVVRDVNRPSILFWDNGNEGGFNTNLDKIFDELDPQHRRVLHPWATFSGVNTAHYLAYDKAEIASGGKKVYYSNNQEIVATNDAAKYIYMPTEFLHGLYDGGAGAGLDDYWRMMTASKLLGGGFIWALLDDGIKRPDTGAIDVAGNQAPDGIVGPYRQREGSFYSIKEIWSPIQVTRETNGTFTVENHYSFTDANQCEFEWQLRKFSAPDEQGQFKILAEGKIAAPEIPPGKNGTLQMQLPAAQKNANALALRVSDPQGRELWTYVWPLARRAILPAGAGIGGNTEISGGILVLRDKDVVARIDNTTGNLLEVERNGKKFSLTNGPRPATTNVTMKNVVWTVRRDGWIICDYTYAVTGTNDYFGVLFDYPENLVQHKRWLGDGPYRVWKNRLRGVTLNVWENDYNNTLTGFRDWIYPEFKGFFANVRWLQLDTAEGQITVVNNSAVPFVQVLTPEFAPSNLTGNAFAPVPQCGLGFLDAIPPIGSKFKEARFGGPQGQPNVAHGEYSGSMSFYFGKFP